MEEWLEISARFFLSYFTILSSFSFCEGLIIALCEFIRFIIWFTKATVLVKENWFPFQNVMFLIFSQHLGLFFKFPSAPKSFRSMFQNEKARNSHKLKKPIWVLWFAQKDT